MHDNARTRREVLALLYARREADEAAGRTHRAGFVHQADILAAVAGNARFALSVLAEAGHVEKSGFAWRITGQGVLHFESLTDTDTKE